MEKFTEIFTAELNSDLANQRVENIIFDIVFKHIKDMVFIMKVEANSTFRYLFVNEPGLQHPGLTNNPINKTIEEVLPSERSHSLIQAYRMTVEKKETLVFADEVFLPDGTKVAGESFITPIMDESNNVCYVVAVTRDITTSLMEKQQLMESEQRYRSIVDHNLDGILSVNLNGMILEVNPAGNKLMGFTKKQMTSRSIFDLITEQDLVEFKTLFYKTKVGYPSESLDCRFVHRKGHLLTIHIKTVPIVINTEIVGIYVIMRDISEHAKNAETIKYMAFHDQLTGLLNRSALLEDLEDHINIAKNTGKGFALLSIDLDRFKYLNDTLGHIVGDEILIKVAERLSEFKHKSCQVYRQGGDEFIILLPDTDR